MWTWILAIIVFAIYFWSFVHLHIAHGCSTVWAITMVTLECLLAFGFACLITNGLLWILVLRSVTG